MKSFWGFKTCSASFEVLGLAVAMIAGAAFQSPCQAGTVTFGTGAYQFSMEFVTIGNPGNPADTTGTPNPAGAVAYEYGLGKFEVSEDMIERYNANFGTANSLVITKDTRGSTAKPATNISWNEAARFVNWLNTSTGNQAAYKFTTSGVNDNIALWAFGDAGYDASNPYRNSLAKYVLPSYNEWYKAAYYNPVDSNYYDFPNGSNTAPTPVFSGNSPNTAVYSLSFPQGPADVDQAGGLSPYGVMGLAGNVGEWDENSFDLTNSSGSHYRGVRGGTWGSDSNSLSSSSRNSDIPSFERVEMGFRVASLSPSASPVPEPSTLVIGTLFGLGGLLAKRRIKR
jgi:sulfatase modifying factor 1